jgi:hypothetical protein
MFDSMTKTRISELVRIGRKLAAELDDLAARMNTKSDEHAVLLWEADILRAKADAIEGKCGVSPNLRTSVLLPNSGNGLIRTYPEVVDKVRAFHAEYDEQAQLPW